MKKWISGVSAVLAGLWWATPVWAQGENTINLGARDTFVNLGSLTIPTMIGNFITIALIVAGVVFFFMLVAGGVRWILSGGEKASVETARNQITNALIGLVVVFSAWAIITLIKTLFNVDILKLAIPALNKSVL